jgi:hypothetical protein
MAARIKKKLRAKVKCRTTGCKNLRHARGLCQPCLREAQELIRQGEYTENELIDLGIIMPVGKPGRKRTGLVAKALAKSR